LRLVRVELRGGARRLGVVVDDSLALFPESSLGLGRGFLSLVRAAAMRGLGVVEYVRARLESGRRLRRLSFAELEVAGKTGRLLIPIVPPEVWGAGVTYLRSREAREYETTAKGIYDLVYEAERPELFFKATPSRCVGPGEVAYVRGDSKWSVPEPELAVVLGPRLEIAGFTIGNDLSARDIEGENPLYLPQAKIYKGSCAIGPAIAPAEVVGDWRSLQIEMRILREGEEVFRGSTKTSNMKRSLEELIGFLKRYNPVPPGTVFLTGTGIVPPDDFTLKDGDLVEIEVEKIGVLRNVIAVLSS
jgi:2-dehydro-3-deoxy-D-arabinonate dehydratase